ncbi:MULTISPECIES: dethiobiotin synthase [unclassified Imperialibacter]|uniref:dethiobiotin synthase n=1 Tax=unclassified Imperialibacter TaxID=2629706 RepID=UPI001254FB4B|nr:MULTISPECIES: dethiobiotin synthase [unclassified Imperialibacter]CAD5252945.1 ATP-dependent dethiobiotin synthetase BioD [Imperialibacter sp. 75]CAD5281211.1 ATP-dependent dethiobiotin synthetase BioD [Imperialibacter sp. 89]VVT28982.1 ATP-dependent dethiobiotin synthetase BioD [Imperialibacter sp. EC-SDR9]
MSDFKPATLSRYFVTAIGTDSGKTLVSAIVCEALHADYWKPIQAGMPRDTDTVQSLVSNEKTQFHSEAYLLNTPASPHAAAKADGVEISMTKIKLPQTNNCLIIEGAGGLLVPLNDYDFVSDLIIEFKAEVILVANLYLGSINHTLLSAEYLKTHKVPVAGIIFNGPANPESEQIIMAKTGWPVLLHIHQEEKIDTEVVKKYAAQLNKNWK